MEGAIRRPFQGIFGTNGSYMSIDCTSILVGYSDIYYLTLFNRVQRYNIHSRLGSKKLNKLAII